MFPVMLASVRYRALPTTFRRIVIGPVNIASTTGGDKPKLSMNWRLVRPVFPARTRVSRILCRIAILHAAIVPKIVVEHECWLARSWQAGSGIYDAWIQ